MRNKFCLASCVALVALLVVALPAHAALVTGTLFADGQANVSISAPGGVGNIHFNADSAGDMFQVNNQSSGTFAPLQGTLGKIVTDINQATMPAGVVLGSPVLFMTFDSMPGLTYSVTMVDLGSFGPGSCGAPPTVPQFCSPSGTPFNLSNTAPFPFNGGPVNKGQAGFGTEGFFTLAGMNTPYTGSFTAATTQSYQSILAIISGGGTYSTSWAARFDQIPQAGVPEPGTSVLLVSGGLLLAAGIWGRKRASRKI